MLEALSAANARAAALEAAAKRAHGELERMRGQLEDAQVGRVAWAGRR